MDHPVEIAEAARRWMQAYGEPSTEALWFWHAWRREFRETLPLEEFKDRIILAAKAAAISSVTVRRTLIQQMHLKASHLRVVDQLAQPEEA